MISVFSVRLDEFNSAGLRINERTVRVMAGDAEQAVTKAREFSLANAKPKSDDPCSPDRTAVSTKLLSVFKITKIDA